MAVNGWEQHQSCPLHVSKEEDWAAGFLLQDLCVCFGSLKSWCSGTRLSGCFLPAASVSRVILSAINCHRGWGFFSSFHWGWVATSCSGLRYSQPGAETVKHSLLHENTSAVVRGNSRDSRLPSSCLLRVLCKGKMRKSLRRGCLAPAYLMVNPRFYRL